MLRMKYVWTSLLVVMFAAMASSMAFADLWMQVDYDEPLTPTSGPVATISSEPTFTDVDPDHPFWGYIEELAAAATEAISNGIVGGYGDGSYQPNWAVNRAAMAVFIARAVGITAAAEEDVFPDVPAGYWAAGDILALVDAGIVGGYPDGLYRPTVPVTRAQMAVFVVNARGETSAPYTSDFVDVDADYWAAGYIQTCVDNFIVAGYPDGFFRPDKRCDRGEMAVFIWRALVDDVVLNGADAPSAGYGTTDAAFDPGGPDTAVLVLPDAIGATTAANAELGEGVFAYVVLDAHKVATGSATFVVEGATEGIVGSDSVDTTAGDYDDEIDAGYPPYLAASYEIPSGLAPDDYTVTVTLPGGGVLELGTFTIEP